MAVRVGGAGAETQSGRLALRPQDGRGGAEPGAAVPRSAWRTLSVCSQTHAGTLGRTLTHGELGGCLGLPYNAGHDARPRSPGPTRHAPCRPAPPPLAQGAALLPSGHLRPPGPRGQCSPPCHPPSQGEGPQGGRVRSWGPFMRPGTHRAGHRAGHCAAEPAAGRGPHCPLPPEPARRSPALRPGPGPQDAGTRAAVRAPSAVLGAVGLGFAHGKPLPSSGPHGGTARRELRPRRARVCTRTHRRARGRVRGPLPPGSRGGGQSPQGFGADARFPGRTWAHVLPSGARAWPPLGLVCRRC